MYKVLKSTRLTLRRFKESDAQDIFEGYATDPEVTKYLTWDVHPNVELTKSLLNGWIKEDDNDFPNITRFAITLTGTDKVIGSIDLVKNGTNYEIGYVLSRKYRNKGIMSEALSLFLDYLKSLGYKEVPIRAQVANIASNKVIQKKNGIYTGQKEIYLPLKNKTVLVNEYYFDLK